HPRAHARGELAAHARAARRVRGGGRRSAPRRRPGAAGDPHPAAGRPRGQVTRRSCAGAAVAAAALAGLGCTNGAAPSAGGDRIVVARPADPLSLDPARATDIESLEVAEQVYGRLVRFAPGRLEPEPDLATNWSVSNDGTVWT